MMDGSTLRAARRRLTASVTGALFAVLGVVACSSRTAEPAGLGAECNFDEQCGAVAGKEVVCVCTPDGGARPQCVARLGAGEDCTRRTQAYGVPCATGLGCAEAGGGTRLCMATVGAGADCTGAPCGEGLFCDGKTCAASHGTGEACTPNTSGACVTGAVCGSAGICVTPRGPGVACAANDECSEGKCIPSSGSDAGGGVCAYPTPPGAIRLCQR